MLNFDIIKSFASHIGSQLIDYVNQVLRNHKKSTIMMVFIKIIKILIQLQDYDSDANTTTNIYDNL